MPKSAPVGATTYLPLGDDINRPQAAHRERRANPSYSKRFGTPDQPAPGLPVRTGTPR